MITKKTLAARALAIALVFIWLTTPYSYACGPFFPQVVFTYKLHPDLPLTDYAAGNLGILQPTYARSYLYVAYRYLTGIGFDQNEQKALVGLWDDRLQSNWLGDGNWINAWLTTRSKIPNAGPASVTIPYQRWRTYSNYSFYENCLVDTFRSATKTLEERMKTFGRDSAELHEWLKGQDQVLANCSKGETIPTPLPSTANALLRSDRTYQIAAANFYTGNFETAEKIFRDISQDASSPWRQIASLLAVRALIRRATLEKSQDAANQHLLADAEADLKQLLADPRAKAIHASAKRLSAFVEVRLKPEARLRELSQILLKKDIGDTLKQDLWDYTVLLDKQRPSFDFDDLTNWVFTFQEKDQPIAAKYAVERWRQTKSLAWLVAALAKIDVRDANATELLKSAASVDQVSPAYLTVFYHRIRILSAMGNRSEARKLLDEFFLRTGPKAPVSAQNLFRAQRLALAQNLDEFLKYAPRTPALITSDETGRELPDDAKRQSAGSYFDDDTVQAFNKALPLQFLKQASFSKVLPVHLRRELLLATWVRAVLLGDDKLALELAPEIGRLIPQLSEAMRAYQNVSDPKARRLEAVLIVLKNPGMSPFVSTGLGRLTQLSRIDNYRDNWWCAPAVIFRLDSVSSSTIFGLAWKDVSTKAIPPRNFPSFLSDAQKNTARKEIAKLMQIETAPNYLGKEVINWAKMNNADPRVPESLHLVVRSTRYGCGDNETSAVSKEAFQLLHKNYPSSEWTRRTPYWF
ncbi:MAG: hypothetical protein ACM3TN_12695 [Alphaproteobacteria bacterium]